MQAQRRLNYKGRHFLRTRGRGPAWLQNLGVAIAAAIIVVKYVPIAQLRLAFAALRDQLTEHIRFIPSEPKALWRCEV